MTAALCREAEQKRQAIALEKQQAAEAKERELAAQRAQREAERQALRRLQKTFGVRMEGSAAVDKPPKVTTSAFRSLMLHEKGKKGKRRGEKGKENTTLFGVSSMRVLPACFSQHNHPLYHL